ncbi:MAG TPA: hypothetical protein VGO80_06355 [Solirubrobacteraceae bacterium]|jgi:hypothetical protein|nr:hypothetical protein [Solirubrobacteraceae bacterium]
MTVTPQIDFQAMVDRRRAYGDRTFGTRHLTGNYRQLRRATTEIADCHVYLTLELDSRRRRCTLTAGHHRIIGGLLTDIADVGEVLADATRMICDPQVAFNDLRQERWGYGERKHAQSYIGRDNLYEALEELADAHIFVTLQAERLRARGQYPEEIRAVLVDVQERIEALAFAVACAQAGAQEPTVRDRLVGVVTAGALRRVERVAA